jgi:hypothetical protein
MNANPMVLGELLSGDIKNMFLIIIRIKINFYNWTLACGRLIADWIRPSSVVLSETIRLLKFRSFQNNMTPFKTGIISQTSGYLLTNSRRLYGYCENREWLGSNCNR